jgi:hypothetical protein
VWATSKEPVAVWVRAVSMKIEVDSIQKWNKGLMISETRLYSSNIDGPYPSALRLIYSSVRSRHQ